MWDPDWCHSCRGVDATDGCVRAQLDPAKAIHQLGPCLAQEEELGGDRGQQGQSDRKGKATQVIALCSLAGSADFDRMRHP